MACDTVLKPRQTAQDRAREVKAALDKIQAGLQANSIQVVIGANGAVTFKNWGTVDRDGLSDVCAFRKLSAQGSWALKQAVARAETLQGRKVNHSMIVAGVHSHDGGSTWNKGH